MNASPEHLIRMELHIEQLIRMIANLNERIQVLEHKHQEPCLKVVGN
ncbi:hypothetical protein [Paenisporosarcina indica]|nr:hypothetical protein [Paenisporosarcina indica]